MAVNLSVMFLVLLLLFITAESNNGRGNITYPPTTPPTVPTIFPIIVTPCELSDDSCLNKTFTPAPTKAPTIHNSTNSHGRTNITYPPTFAITPTISPIPATQNISENDNNINATYTPTLSPINTPTSDDRDGITKIPTVTTNIPTTNIPTVTDIKDMDPTSDPTIEPTLQPTFMPTIPTINPTYNPSVIPTTIPTILPTINPTLLPTINPTYTTDNPSNNPSEIPTINPTLLPTTNPTYNPSEIPTINPSYTTNIPSNNPSEIPTINPTVLPTINPTLLPTINPSYATNIPTNNPSVIPTTTPTLLPTINPTYNPSVIPTITPTLLPTINPSYTTNNPTNNPSVIPTITPTLLPTVNPTQPPTRINEGGVATEYVHVTNSITELIGQKAQNSDNASINTGLIIGASICGVCIVVFCVVLCIKCRKTLNENEEEATNYNVPQHIKNDNTLDSEEFVVKTGPKTDDGCNVLGSVVLMNMFDNKSVASNGTGNNNNDGGPNMNKQGSRYEGVTEIAMVQHLELNEFEVNDDVETNGMDMNEDMINDVDIDVDDLLPGKETDTLK